MGKLEALTLTDLRNIRRDSLLKFLIVYPLALGLLMRFLVPWVTDSLADTFDLTPYWPLLAGFIGVLVSPALAGYLVGFLLLDERDAGVLAVLRVSPLPMNGYLLYRISLPVLIGFLAVLIVFPLMNIEQIPLAALVPIALLAALEAPMYAMLLAAIAKNKVQGLALMKGMGVFFLAPFVAWFVDMPWQLLLGIFPTYWPVKAYWVALDGGDWWVFFAVGLVYHLALLTLQLRVFDRQMAR